MRKINKWLGWLLATILALVVVAGIELYLDRKIALEYAVSTFTDYRLSINGLFRFRMSGDVVRINLSNVALRSKLDDQVLLTAGRLELVAKVNGLSLTSIKLHQLTLKNAEAHLTRHQDGSYNWPLPAASESSAATDWNNVLGKINIEQSQLQLSGFTPQPLQLQLNRLALSGAQTQRQLTLDGQLNQFPLKLSASVENLSNFFLQHQAITISATGDIDSLNVKANGVLGIDDEQTRLQLAFDDQDFSALSSLIHADIPRLEQISASTTLLERDGDYQLKNIKLSMHGPALTLTTTGDATQRDDSIELALDIDFSSQDISQLSTLQALAQWQGWDVELKTTLNYKTGQAQLSSSRFKAGNKKQQLDLTAETLQLQHKGQVITDIQASKADLGYQFSDDSAASQAWRYQYQADTLDAQINASHDIKITTQGHYKTLPIAIDGLWQAGGDYHFAVNLDQAKATLKGYLRDETFSINGKLTTSSLKPLATLLDEDEVPVDRGELDIGFLAQGEILTLSHLDLLLYNGDSALHVQGSARNLSDLDGLNFDVNIAAGELGALNQWIGGSAHTVDRSLAALSEPESFASQSDVAYRKSLPLPSPWLAPLMQQLALKSWLDDYPALNGKTQVDLTVKGSGDTIIIDISKVDVQSRLANIQWVGHINNRPNNFSLNGRLHAELKKTAFEQIATEAVINLDTTVKNNGPLTLEKIHIIAGNTELQGKLELSIDDQLKAVNGHIDFKQLDIRPYLPKAKIIAAADSNDTTDDDKDDTKITDQPLFSTEKIPLGWLPTYDIDVALRADQMATPWFTSSEVKVKLSHSKNIFSLESADLLIEQAKVHSYFRLDHNNATPTVSFYFRSDNFDPDVVTLVRNYDIVQKGHASVLIDLSGKGDSQQQLAANLNGKFSLVTRDSVLNGSDINDLSPAVLKEINRKVNPFYNKDKVENTELECGVIHFDFKDGLMTADKSIVLVSPEIVFGAHGVIDLKSDTLRMQIIPQTRKGLGLSITGTFAKMAVIDGPIRDPGVSFDATSAALTGTRDVTGTILLGPLYWIYLGQAQKFLASGKACEKVISKVVPEFAQTADEKKKEKEKEKKKKTD